MGIRKKKTKGNPDSYLIKRCPECFASLPIDATHCFSCKARVGKVDRHGKAKRPINWYSYITCILSWLALILYIKWAFF
jgi:ribosomal protein L40E